MSGKDARARDAILGRLREVLIGPSAALRGPAAAYPPERRPLTTVGRRPDGPAAALGAELRKLGGGFDLMPDAATARERTAELIVRWNEEGEPTAQDTSTSTSIEVLSWAPEHLPLPGLEEALNGFGIHMLHPADLRRRDILERCAASRIGLTSVDAAIAATGTLVLSTGPGRSRAASLLPERHLAVVPTSRIYDSLEAWLATARGEGALDDHLRESRQIIFVTGPSKSADIELNLTLGVHGPGYVHGVIYDDAGTPTPPA